VKAFFPYAEETHGFVVRVAANFLPEQSDPRRGNWFWAYHIRIENAGDFAGQLLTRRWEITDGRGALQIVEGEGVVGEQPVIKPGGSYDYVSGCNLSTPHGMMVGTYQLIGENGSRFEIAVPRFHLKEPVVSE
jgi:ApaG protein